MSELREYCQQIAALRDHRSVEALLLEHGHDYVEHAPFTCPARFKVLRQQCFDNAFRLARRVPSLRYVEGIALSIIPMAHAWCVDEHDRIIDLTWSRWLPLPMSTHQYFGVPIRLDVCESIRKRHNLAILHNWCGGLPLLKMEPADFLDETSA